MLRAALPSLIVAALLAGCTQEAQAGLRRWVDQQGRTHITDAPDNDRKAPVERAESQVASTIRLLQDRYGDHERANLHDPPADRAATSVEAAQAKLMLSRWWEVQRTDPERIDMHFVGFAGDAKQDVFMLETLFVSDQLERRFELDGRSSLLINHRSTTFEHLIASPENLEAVLKVHGERMDENDFLFLFLTSHGSRSHELAVDFAPYTSAKLEPSQIRDMLDRANIKWRVIVISACYSGGFIDALRSPHTIIATAAHEKRPSFGCGEDDELTYYGRAIFERQFAAGSSLFASLDGAERVVTEMEDAQGIERPSNPQLWVGSRMKSRLEAFERHQR